MNTRDFLDAVRAKHGLTSDYQLCKLLGWRSSRASMYRTTARELDDDGCLQIAAALEVPPAYVMASIAGSRAKSTKAKREWQRAARLLKRGVAAALAIAIVGGVQMPRAAQARASVSQATDLYIMRTRRRRRRGRPDRAACTT